MLNLESEKKSKKRIFKADNIAGIYVWVCVIIIANIYAYWANAMSHKGKFMWLLEQSDDGETSLSALGILFFIILGGLQIQFAMSFDYYQPVWKRVVGPTVLSAACFFTALASVVFPQDSINIYCHVAGGAVAAFMAVYGAHWSLD